MRYDGIDDFLKRGREALARGPVALIFVEDFVEVASTLRHHIDAGFRTVAVFGTGTLSLPDPVTGLVHQVPYNVHERDAVPDAVNRVIDAAPGVWMYYCYNAEYLFHPFCETRNVSELLAFHAEERRDAMLAYVVDLYAGDLAAAPDAVSLEDAQMDKAGYYALRRYRGQESEPMDRQLDFFGGLRWRFEEHIPVRSRRIDRIALFRAKPGLRLLPDHKLNDEEMNTYACPWHNNLTAAIASFRTAKALRTNPGSKYEIGEFKSVNSIRFEWTSQQLMDLGLMEPGQWF